MKVKGIEWWESVISFINVRYCSSSLYSICIPFKEGYWICAFAPVQKAFTHFPAVFSVSTYHSLSHSLFLPYSRLHLTVTLQSVRVCAFCHVYLSTTVIVFKLWVCLVQKNIFLKQHNSIKRLLQLLHLNVKKFRLCIHFQLAMGMVSLAVQLRKRSVIIWVGDITFHHRTISLHIINKLNTPNVNILTSTIRHENKPRLAWNKSLTVVQWIILLPFNSTGLAAPRFAIDFKCGGCTYH